MSWLGVNDPYQPCGGDGWALPVTHGFSDAAVSSYLYVAGRERQYVPPSPEGKAALMRVLHNWAGHMHDFHVRLKKP